MPAVDITVGPSPITAENKINKWPVVLSCLGLATVKKISLDIANVWCCHIRCPFYCPAKSVSKITEGKIFVICLALMYDGCAGVNVARLPPGPPLPRPILPQDRSVLDRLIEYFVGDGPQNRFALICSECRSHNGMALREEFEYIGKISTQIWYQAIHRCGRCFAWLNLYACRFIPIVIVVMWWCKL